MKTGYPVISLPVLFLFLLATPLMGSSNWVEFYTGKMGNVASYKQIITKEGQKRYVIKETLSDKGREKYIQERKEKGLPTEGYEKISNIQSLNEISCKEKKIMNISVLCFDTDGKLLNSYFVNEPKFLKIPDNVFFNSLLKEVCK